MRKLRNKDPEIDKLVSELYKLIDLNKVRNKAVKKNQRVRVQTKFNGNISKICGEKCYACHQFIIDAGHIRDLPSRSELQAILKHNLILYTKTDDGKFVPVWKAE